MPFILSLALMLKNSVNDDITLLAELFCLRFANIRAFIETNKPFLIILTSLLVPSLSVPQRINSSASANEEIPPAALTFTSFPTCFLISFTSSNVAPADEKPVDVLIYSAPAFVTISHILIFSSSVSRQVSIMTFKILPLHASWIWRISSSTSW